MSETNVRLGTLQSSMALTGSFVPDDRPVADRVCSNLRMNRADPTAHRLLRAAHGHAMANGLHRGDTGIRRRTGPRGRAPARAALAPTRLRRDDPGLRRSPVAHRLGEERRPGFLRDLLRRGRRDPERGRAARPTTPDPVRADPQRLRQSVRERLRPFVLSATGRATAGRRRDPDGGRGRWPATSCSCPTRATASSTRSRSAWRRAGASRGTGRDASSPTTGRQCARCGRRR